MIWYGWIGLLIIILEILFTVLRFYDLIPPIPIWLAFPLLGSFFFGLALLIGGLK